MNAIRKTMNSDIKSRWEKAQEWEKAWHGACINTLGEELKQLLYAEKMGLYSYHDGKSPYNFDLGGASVLDIGSGPASLLLKCVNFSYAKVLEPMEMPDWVLARYEAAGIKFALGKAEAYADRQVWDEAWIYNVLQHTEDPELVIMNARRSAKIIRLFEWIDFPTNEGHLHTLAQGELDKWLCGEGKVEKIDGENECYGTAYYGIFV